MLAYEYYWMDKENRVHVIGIIPERRRWSDRITAESILNLGRATLGEEIHIRDLFFAQVRIDETGLIYFLETTIEELPFGRI